jgi:hypothetical protein
VPTANALTLVTRQVLHFAQLISATTGCYVRASTNLHATALPPLVTPASSSMLTAFVKRVMLRTATLATNGLQPLANAPLLLKSQLSAIQALKRTAANRASFLASHAIVSHVSSKDVAKRVTSGTGKNVVAFLDVSLRATISKVGSLTMKYASVSALKTAQLHIT